MSGTKEAERTIFLVNPGSPGIKLAVGPKSIGVPSGLGVVGSMVEQIKERGGFGNEVRTVFVEEDLGQTANPKAGDLVLASSFSFTANRVKQLAGEVHNKGAFLVAGGIHATMVPEDFARAGAISFMGEAGNSAVFADLMKSWLHKGVLSQGVIIPSEGINDPTSISLAGLPVSSAIYELLDRNRFTHSTHATIGCNKSCEFCTARGGKVVRKRPVEEVIAEIKLRGLDKIGFTIADSDLGAGGPDYLHDLLEALAKLKIPRAWNSETTISCLSHGGDRLFEALAKAQCHRLFVGIESPNAENLTSVGKRHNLKYKDGDVREIIRQAHKRGIKITGLFMVGFLTDTVDSIRNIEDYIKFTEVDDANIFVLTPLPGSKIYQKFAAEGLFDPQTLDTDKLDLRHLLFNHPIGNDRLMKEYSRLCDRVFAVPTVLSRSAKAFWRSYRHHLPESFERDLRNSFVTAMLQADVHRGARGIGLINWLWRS